ncbi:MAG: YhfC family intramembrane metalloprotease [Ruminococcus sp.]|nr:YhfC family intramembrane metalloprotease [Ruminococcus sp.]
MENTLHFETGAIIGLIIEAVLVIALPVIALIIWKKKTKEPLFPVLIGAVSFIGFGLLLKSIPALLLLTGDNPVAKAITGNVWLSAIIGGGLLAGIFEEGGRFISYKFFLKKYKSKKTAIFYGIGHGGIESAYVGYNALMFAAMGIIINGGGIDTIIGNLDESTKATALAQLGSYANSPLYFPAVLGTLERIAAMIFHTSMSVFVFAAAREKKYIFLFPLAIILHTAMNSMVGFVNSGMISVIALEFIMLAYALVIAFFAYKLYKSIEETIPNK